MTDERAADQAQYLRIVAFDSEVRHEGGFAAASKASEAASFSQSRNDCYLRIPAIGRRNSPPGPESALWVSRHSLPSARPETDEMNGHASTAWVAV